MSHRLLAAALAIALAAPAGAALAQGPTPFAGSSAAASLGYTAAPPTMAVTLPELSVRIPPADPATTGSIRPHRGHARTGS